MEKLIKTAVRILLESDDHSMYENAMELLWSGDKSNIEIVQNAIGDVLDENILKKNIINQFLLFEESTINYNTSSNIEIDWILKNGELDANSIIDYVKCSSLHIYKLPNKPLNTINKFENLTSLSMAWGNHIEIPNEILSLNKLKVLVIQKFENITRIPNEISNLQNIEYLAMNWCGLENISYNIDGCLKLKKLIFNDNDLKEIDLNIINHNTLKYLDLSGNPKLKWQIPEIQKKWMSRFGDLRGLKI